MRTKIKVADVVRIGGCQTGLERAIAIGERAGISADAEVEFDEVIRLCTENKERFLVDYFTRHKAALLEYTDSSVQFYLFNNAQFETLELARAAKAAWLQERLAHHTELTTVGFTRSLGEDHAWETIDLNTFSMPPDVDEYHFHIFNHRTGAHDEAATLEEAKSDYAAMIQSHLALDAQATIAKRLLFAEDGVSIRDEVVE